MTRLLIVFVLLCLLLPGVLGVGLFGFLDNERQIYWPSDLNGEDVNFFNLWAVEAWIDTLHVDDLNVTNITDYNVLGDVNATGSIEAGVCIVADCFASASDLDNWIDASGANWVFNGFGIDVDGDISSDSDIISGNNLSCVNDLDVGDNADIGGDLAVVGDVNVSGAFGVVGSSYFGGSSVFADTVWIEGDLNAVNIGFTGFIFGDGSKLTGITGGGGGGGIYTGEHPIEVSDANVISLASDFNQMYVSQFDLNLDLDGGFANSVYLVLQSVDGGGA